MAKLTKPTKPVKHVENHKDKGAGPPQLAAWREFYAGESAKLKAKTPGIKGVTLRKRISAAYKKYKEQQSTTGDSPRTAAANSTGCGEDE